VKSAILKPDLRRLKVDLGSWVSGPHCCTNMET
jgi:hypothetical protein